MIPHGTSTGTTTIGRRYIPDWEPSASPDAWHPDDELFVPMRHTDGHLLGILSVGEPRSGTRPSAHDVAGLVAVADHAALAAPERPGGGRRGLPPRRRCASSCRSPSRLTETLSAGAILQSVCEGISEALGFDKVCIDLPDPVTGVFTSRAATGWTLEDMRQNTPMTLWELAPLLDPPFERQGCFLLSLEDATARLPDALTMRRSEMNGRGPHAWDRHWLTVPMYDRDGEVIGLIWADDPRSRLLPSTELPPGPARVREPGDRGARLGRALRGDALPGRARPAHPALQPARVQPPAAGGGVARPPLRHPVRARGARRRRLQGHQRPSTATSPATPPWPGSPTCWATCCEPPTRRSGSAATSSRSSCPSSTTTAADPTVRRIAAHLEQVCAAEGHPVTASFGVAVFGGDVHDPEALLRAADAAMYAAKRSGERVRLAA